VSEGQTLPWREIGVLILAVIGKTYITDSPPLPIEGSS